MALPPGDPATLLTLAAQLEAAANGAHSLGGTTLNTMTLVREAAQWTGASATAATNLATDLGGKMSGTSGPLLQIASAVRSYAGDLQAAQQAVSAYNLGVADQGMAAGSASYASQLQTLADTATKTVTTLDQSATQAASTITEAAGELGGTFALPPTGQISLSGTGTLLPTGYTLAPGIGQTVVNLPGIGLAVPVNVPADAPLSVLKSAASDDEDGGKGEGDGGEGDGNGGTDDDTISGPLIDGQLVDNRELLGGLFPTQEEVYEEYNKWGGDDYGDGKVARDRPVIDPAPSGGFVVKYPPGKNGKGLGLIEVREPNGDVKTYAWWYGPQPKPPSS